MPGWASLLLLLLPLMLIVGQYWRSGRKDFWRYGLIWIVIIAIIAIGYDALQQKPIDDPSQVLPINESAPKQSI